MKLRAALKRSRADNSGASRNGAEARTAARESVGRKLLARRRWWLAAGLSAFAAAAFWGLGVTWQAYDGLEGARATGGGRAAVRFERERLGPRPKEGIRLFQSTQAVRAVARFNDSYFAATGGGLVEMSESGEVVRVFGVLEGLPESDLTCLAAHAGRLYIGTRSKGLLAFDGQRFERYWWPDREALYVTALLSDQGRLLIGTFAGGLLGFDGEGYEELGPPGEQVRPDAATVLVRHGPRLYVGTYGRGLWVSEGGRWARFTSADGLNSDRVVGVVEAGGAVLVATDFGLAAAEAAGLVVRSEGDEGRKWRDVATVPALSGLAGVSGREVFACKENGETSLLEWAGGGAWAGRPVEFAWAGGGAEITDARLSVLEGSLWLLGSRGIRRADLPRAAGGGGSTPARLSFVPFGGHQPPQSPTSNVISALAFDEDGNLWAGSFRDGLDLFAPSGERSGHLSSDDLREVNAILPDGAGGVVAATSQGLVRLDSSLRPTRRGAEEGLAGKAVLHVARLMWGRESGAASADAEAPTGGRMLIATARGLTLAGPEGLRTLTTVQGLPANSVYAVWSGGGRAFAGTLGGLAELAAGRVVRVYKDSNSALTHNWVTALCEVGGRLFVGTYGGGVFELTPAGELRGFAAEAGRAFVNPNAMWGDTERLYVGTLDGALVYDLRTQRWARLRDELPAATVLSVVGHGGHVYFGTTGGLARFDKSYFKRAG